VTHTSAAARRMTNLPGPHRAAILALVVFALAAGSASAQARPQPRGMLRQFAPGLLVRTSYVADSSAAYRVEIWDLVVGPGKTSAAAKLPGGAILEVRAGSGTLVIESKRQEFRPGAVVTISQGSAFALENGRKDLALAIRATVISLRRS